MFTFKALLLGIVTGMLLVTGSSVYAQEENEEIREPLQSSAEDTGEILGYVETDGGMILPIKEETGFAEQIPADTTLKDILANYAMSLESEAKLVHREPGIPFILNGVRYEPEQIHLFDGQRLGFAVGDDGLLYAFSSYSAYGDFLAEKLINETEATRSDYSIFYELVYYGGQNRLSILPNVTLFSLPGMDNMISSMKISPSATCGCTLFEDADLQGDYFSVSAGTNWPDLGTYGWDNRASSLVVWP